VPDPPHNGRGLKSRLVLIVDDDARNLKLARDVLLAAGFRTLVAGTARSRRAASNLPDVILIISGCRT
jgi:two-component system cell cycle response regulator DivK